MTNANALIRPYMAISHFVKGNRLLVAIGIAGFALRIIPIFWGIPINEYVRSYHPDEYKVLRSVLGFPGIYFSTGTFMGYGTFIQYTLGFLAMPVKLLFSVLGLQESYKIAMWFLTRFVNVLLGTATIYCTYQLAKTIFNKNTALLSAAMLALSFYHVLNSAVFTLDVAMGLMIVVNFLLCFRALEKNGITSFIALGVASGILIGIKITGGLFVVVPVVLLLLKYSGRDSKDLSWTDRHAKMLKNLTCYAFAMLIVFLLYHPHVYLDPEKYINFFLREKRDWVDRTSIPFWNMFLVWIKSTIKAMGLPVTILAMFGFVIPRKDNWKRQYALLLFLVLYYGFWRWFLAPRYVISVAPILSISAAHACGILLERKNPLFKSSAIGIIAISIIYSFYLCVAAINLRINDTRIVAAKFIMQNIEAGRSVGLGYTSEKYKNTHNWINPRINWNKYKQVDLLSRPEFIVLSSYTYKKILNTLNSDKIDDDYVLRQEYFTEWYRNSPPSPELFRFYHDLLIAKHSDYALMKSFQIDSRVPIEFPPPEIRIYSRNS